MHFCSSTTKFLDEGVDNSYLFDLFWSISYLFWVFGVYFKRKWCIFMSFLSEEDGLNFNARRSDWGSTHPRFSSTKPVFIVRLWSGMSRTCPTLSLVRVRLFLGPVSAFSASPSCHSSHPSASLSPSSLSSKPKMGLFLSKLMTHYLRSCSPAPQQLVSFFFFLLCRPIPQPHAHRAFQYSV